MQKLNTLSDAGICLVIGCFASAGDVWCTVRHCPFTHKNHTPRRSKRHLLSIPTLLLSGMSLGTPKGCFFLPFCFVFYWAQAYHHARLDCDAPQLMRRCTVLPPTNRCYWSVRAHQRPRYTC